jgi:hypothetical protein
MLNQVHIERRVLVGFLIGILAMNLGVLLGSWKEIMAGKNDFPPFYASAQMVREGQASRMFDVTAENAFVHRVSPIVRPPNNHLPYENLIFLPFTYLQFDTAYVIWTLLSLVMLAGIVLLMRDFWRWRSSFSFTFLVFLAFFPVWYCLGMGQDSILLVLFFALSFWLWKRGQDDLAGFALAFGLFRPQLVLPFVLVAFLGAKWKFVRGFIPGAILVVLLSIWVAGFHGMGDYARILISQGTEGSAEALSKQWCVRPGLMPTLRGLLWILPSWVSGNVRNFLLLSGTFGALLWAAKRMRCARDGAALDLAFAMAVTVITLVSFHSFLHDFSLMILPLLIAGNTVVSSARVTEKSAYLIVTLGFVFFLTPLYLLLILLTPRVGLFAVPTVAFLWLMGRWETNSLSAPAAERHAAEPISLRTA